MTEMLEIVAKRDSLIALLEEERQRWRRSSCPSLSALKTQPTNLFQSLTADYPISPAASDTSSMLFALFAILIAYFASLQFANYLMALKNEIYTLFNSN